MRWEHTAQDNTVLVDSDSEEEEAPTPAGEREIRKPMMTAVKQGPPKPRHTLEVAPTVPETAAPRMETANAEVPSTSVPETPDSDKSHVVQKLPLPAVPKSLGCALPAAPAPVRAADTAGGRRAPSADGTAPEGETNPTQIPMDVLAKLKELEELKAKYAGLLNHQTSSGAPVAAVAPPAPPLHRQDSYASPPEQKQVFTPENFQGSTESIAPSSSGRDSVAKMEIEGQKETPPATGTHSADEDEQLHEAYNLEHKDRHMSRIFPNVDGKSCYMLLCHSVATGFHGMRLTNMSCVSARDQSCTLVWTGADTTRLIHALEALVHSYKQRPAPGQPRSGGSVAGRKQGRAPACTGESHQAVWLWQQACHVGRCAGRDFWTSVVLTYTGHPAPPLAGISLTGRICKADAQAQRNENPTRRRTGRRMVHRGEDAAGSWLFSDLRLHFY